MDSFLVTIAKNYTIVKQTCMGAQSLAAAYSSLLTGYNSTYAEHISRLNRQIQQTFIPTDKFILRVSETATRWDAISQLFDVFDLVESFNASIAKYIGYLPLYRRAADDKAWSEIYAEGRSVMVALTNAAVICCRAIIASGEQEAFSEWILANRKKNNGWVFAAIGELLAATRGNRRFKLLKTIEDRKDSILGAERIPISPSPSAGVTPQSSALEDISAAGYHSAISRCGLRMTRSVSLVEAFAMIGYDYIGGTLERAINQATQATGRGIAFVDLSGGGTPVDFDLTGIISERATPPAPTAGLDESVIRFFDTVTPLAVPDVRSPRANLVARGATNEWYLLETINGELFRWGLYLDKLIIPAERILSITKSRPTRPERYQTLMGEQIMRAVITAKSTAILRAYEDNIAQNTSSHGVAEAVQDAVVFALSREVKISRAKDWGALMEVTRDETLITGSIRDALVKVVGPTERMDPELALSRIQKYEITMQVFLRGYDDRWRKEKYDKQSYDGSPESMQLFLGFLKLLVEKTIADMTKNNFWDTYMITLKEFFLKVE